MVHTKKRRPVSRSRAAGRAGRGLTALVVVAMVLGGCGSRDDDEEPTPPPTQTTTPAPSTDEPTEPSAPTGEPVPEPTRPADMDRDDVEGAKAAAVYFAALYTYAYVTGDVRAGQEISHAECQFCTGVVDRVADVHAEGGYADGPVVDIVEIDAEPPGEEDEYYSVWLDVVEHPSNRFDASGNVADTSEGGPNEFDLAITYASGDWQVRGAVVRAATEGGAA